MNPNSKRLPINFAKILIVTSVVYLSVISFRYFMIPHLSGILVYAALGATILQYPREMLEAARSPAMVAFGLFCGLNYVFSYSTAANFAESSLTLSRTWESGLTALMVISIAKRDGDVKFGALLLFLTAFFMAAIMLKSPVLFNESFTGRGTQYLSISENVNPHTVGAFQILGIWALLIYGSYRKSDAFLVLLTILISLTFFYVAVIANSRKSIISIILLTLFAVKPYYRANIRPLRTSQKFGGMLLMALLSVAFFIRAQFILSRFLETNNVVERFATFFARGSSNETRVNMIQEAWSCFTQHPLLGVGFNNFRYYSIYETYSHNTYVELLVSCGLLGAIPFVVFFWKGSAPFLKKSRFRMQDEIYRQRLSVIMLFILLLLGGTQIVFYQYSLIVALGVIMSYGYVLQAEALNDRRLGRIR